MDNNQWIDKDFQNLRNIPAKLTIIFKSFCQKALAIANKTRLAAGAKQNDIFQADQDKRNELIAAQNETYAQLAEVRSMVQTFAGDADKRLDTALGAIAPAGDSNQQLLTETRRNKAWERIKPLLDKETQIYEFTQKIKDLVKGFISQISLDELDGTDFDSIAAIRTELPFYIKGRFPENQVPSYLEESINALEQAMADARPDFQEFVNLKKELRSGTYQIDLAINLITDAVKTNTPGVTIPVWEKGQTVVLSS